MVRRGKAPDIFQAGSQPDDNVHLLSLLKCSYQGFQTDRFPSWTSQALSVTGVNQSKARTKRLRHVMPDTYMCLCKYLILSLKRELSSPGHKGKALGCKHEPGLLRGGQRDSGHDMPGQGGGAESQRERTKRGVLERRCSQSGQLHVTCIGMVTIQSLMQSLPPPRLHRPPC